MSEPESEEALQKPWVELAELAEEADQDGLRRAVAGLSDADRTHALAHLEAETLAVVLDALPAAEAAAVVERLPLSQAAVAVEEMAPPKAAALVEELASADRADLIGHVHAGEAEAILAASAPTTAEDVRALLEYPPESAGGLMVTEYLAVLETGTLEDALEQIRANVGRYADFEIQYIYVIDAGGRLRGVLPLRALLLLSSGNPIATAMSDAVFVQADTPLENLVTLFDDHGYLAVPVVDETGVLRGLVRRTSIEEAQLERAEASQMKALGIAGGEELRSMPVWTRSRRRLAWLTLNIGLNVIAASIIALYQETLQAVIALAVFLPIISDMSGCSGNQAVAVSLRELALGVTRPHETFRVWGQEVLVGLVNGAALGALIGVLAWLWQGNVTLGLVVGGALAINTLVAVSIGGCVPLLVKQFGYDPALASGPVLTTLTDMCGFFLALSFATLTLERLVV